MKVKIYYHDTDCGGVVYYANYLKFLEEARTEFFAEKGFPIKALSDRGILFVVARQEIDYKSPAFYADTLKIETRLAEISNVKMVFEHTIKNQEAKLVGNARTTLVCVGRDLKPQSIPADIQKKLTI